MGAVLWSFFPLISLLLLSDAWQAQADSHGEWLSETRRLYRQSYGGGGDLAAGCSECRENESSGVDFKRLETSFLSVVNNSTETLGRRVMNGESLLVHVSTPEGDTILYGSDSDTLKRWCIPASTYKKLKAVSHLPVMAVIVALLNETNVTLRDSALQELKNLLNDASENISNAFKDMTLGETQSWILERVTESLAGGDGVNLTALISGNLTKCLREIAKQAVEDYLTSLNQVIKDNNLIPCEKNNTIIYYGKFAYNGSFIAQYYNRRTNHKARIILQPSFSGDEQYCYLDGNCSTFDFGSVPAASTEVFEHNINDQFVDLNTGNASIHSFLDEEAKRFICSGKFIIPFCPEQTSQPLQGFQTQIEKGYVVLFVFFAACSVVLGIFLLSICYEDRVMKAEMKRSSIDSRERPLSTLSMQSNDE